MTQATPGPGRFGGSVSVPKVKPKRARRDPLAGEGVIVNRARAALKMTAQQFGTVIDTDQTSVTVRTAGGLRLTLRYDGGNYIFSRVYNLRVSMMLPADTLVPAELEISHRGKAGIRYVRSRSSAAKPGEFQAEASTSPAINDLNQRLQPLLRGIDVVSGLVQGPRNQRDFSLVPMGGSYVWVLIPPVFKATAFPVGEPERIIDLFQAAHDWVPSGAAAA